MTDEEGSIEGTLDVVEMALRNGDAATREAIAVGLDERLRPAW